MKKILLSLVLVTSLAFTSCQFDDSDIWDKFGEVEESIRDHEERISALEELCKQMNTNIEALQTLVEALQKNDYVTSVVPVTKDGKVIGYTITFTKSQPITIYHGEDGANGADGKDGKDGYTPQVGVKQGSDGIYYWTIDGEWLYDADGNKVKAVGVDGKDGITPRLKIENGYWYISYDNEVTWIQLGKATGEDGKDGADGANGADGKDGANGDSLFLSVTQDENCVYFTLADGTVLTLPKYKAEAEKSNNKIYYTTSDGKKMFPTKSDGATFGAILISNTYENGQGVLTFDDTVTTIGERAFEDCTSLTSVTIPDSVTSIGSSAFYCCLSLSSVTIPEGVTSIGSSAFCDCISLTSVTIPDSVTSIGSSAFYNCSQLTSVTIPEGVTSIGEEAFSDCTSLTSVYYTGDLSAWCKISFGGYAANPLCNGAKLYLNGVEVTDITIPSDITEIKNYTFSGCTSLTSVAIGDSVTSIGEQAFYGCTSLTSITIPDSVTSIGSYAFYYCASLTSVYISDLSAWCRISFGVGYANPLIYARKLYLNGSEVTQLTIPSDITEVQSCAFYYCESLTSVTIPDSVTKIGDYAFYNCSSLTSVYCKATIPPKGGSGMFEEGDFYLEPIGCKIYVPRNSVELYKSADGWEDYAKYIEGYDFE